MKSLKHILSLLFCVAVVAQTDEERQKYSVWDYHCSRQGFGWEPYRVETEDGWTLTMFRLTSYKDVSIRKLGDNRSKPPVFVLHGAWDSAVGWF